MKLDKIMTVSVISAHSVAPTFDVTTLLQEGNQQIVLRGKPLVKIEQTHVQIGCFRIEQAALLELVSLVKQGRRGLIHKGDYKSKDPETRKPENYEGK